MNGEFDVNEYWLERGKSYFREPRLRTEYYRNQERFLLDVLNASGLPVDRIVELGCGFGRITRLLAETFPAADILALDLSPDQLEQAAKYCAGLRNVSFRQYDIYSGLPLPGGGRDLGIAIEVFLHHPSETVVDVVEKLSTAASWIVSIDWSENWQGARPQHVWIHDYSALFRDLGLSHLALPLPQKIDGMQQQLFVASRVFDLASLRQGLSNIGSSRGPQSTVPADEVSRASPETSITDGWLTEVREAVADLTGHIPAGRTFVLVDDALAATGQPLAGRHAMPFLEREGEYWGNPADDDTAVRELERMRSLGADFIVFTSNTFWWFEYYGSFTTYLRHTCPIVLENEHLAVFDLRGGAGDG